MHKSQVFLYLLLSFVGGIFSASFFKFGHKIELSLLTAGISLIALTSLKNMPIAWEKRRPFVLAGFLIVIFSLGLLRFNLVHEKKKIITEFARASAGIDDKGRGKKINVSLLGYVADEPEVRGKRQTFVFKSKTLESGRWLIKTDEKVLISTELYPKYRYGQHLEVLGEPLIPENFRGSEFDFKSYLAKDGIFTLMNYPEIKERNLKLGFFEKKKIAVFSGIFKTKTAFENSVNRSIPEPSASFIGGILLGSRSQIPQEIKDVFARTGTSHVLAISGYNITIIALIVSWIFLFFFRRPTAFWLSLAGIAVFTVLTGAQASVIRASIMGMLVLLAQREGRFYNARNSIVLAGSVMILQNPEILRYDVGFQLSFLATLGLVLLADPLTRKLERLPKFMNFREILAMTLAAQIFVLPLIVYYFKNLSLVTLPVNVIILPAIPYAMFLGFITGLAGLVLPFLGQLAGYFAWLLSFLIIGVIQLFGKPSWAAINVDSGWSFVALYYLAIFIIFSWRNFISNQISKLGK